MWKVYRRKGRVLSVKVLEHGTHQIPTKDKASKETEKILMVIGFK